MSIIMKAGFQPAMLDPTKKLQLKELKVDENEWGSSSRCFATSKIVRSRSLRKL
eukprot:TRINITY_DN3654_c0_g1_i1.p2 TRINITY_DN3654_c0_g1~~TRINITY_DN3654_c0_g1_i1.p2  ORF type:complete len:54 (-),score=15.60 TRINITY_DN3654_c0_g1_i1:52-213(-)